jgi:hypothetical protein
MIIHHYYHLTHSIEPHPPATMLACLSSFCSSCMNAPPVCAERERRRATMQYTMRRMPFPNMNAPPIHIHLRSPSHLSNLSSFHISVFIFHHCAGSLYRETCLSPSGLSEDDDLGPRNRAVDRQRLHDHAVLVIMPSLLVPTVALLDFRPLSRRRNLHRCPATRCCSNCCNSMFCPFVASLRCFHIPYIGFQRIPSGANSHLGEVANSILCLGKTCFTY